MILRFIDRYEKHIANIRRIGNSFFVFAIKLHLFIIRREKKIFNDFGISLIEFKLQEIKI